MARRLISLILFVALVIALIPAQAGGEAGRRALRVGKFKAPIAELDVFAKRPPRTNKESTKIPSAVSMAMMPDGRVVYWGGLESLEDGKYPLATDSTNQIVSSRTRILDLRRGTPRWTTPRPQDTKQHDLFCADLRLLPDGRVIAVGGTVWEADPIDTGGEPAGTGELFGSNAVRFFDHRDPGWKFNKKFMEYPRWYPTLITLPNGKLLVASGVERLIYNEQGVNVHATETFNPRTGRWTNNGTEGEVSLPLFARLHLMPDGKVFYSGVGQMWGPFGQTYDEALWTTHKVYDPAKNEWTTSGIGAYGARSGSLSVLLPLKPPYKKARVLIAGGTLGSSPGSYTANNFTEIVTYRNGVSESVAAAPLNNPRWYSSGVLLPTGRVLAFSGGDKDEVITPAAEVPVRQAELWMGKRWRPMATARRIRTYHNSAILLPNGAVLVGGHAPINDGYGPTGNTDPPSGTNNLKDPSFEIYKPPYMFMKRPKITRVRRGIAWDRSFSIGVSRARNITRVMLMKLPTTTHITDADMRAVELRFKQTETRRLRAVAPPNGKVAPPGFYYLFVLRKNGKQGAPVPSKARIVRVGATARGGQARAPMGR